MVKLFILSREGVVIPVSYNTERQLQSNAETYRDIIFFY